LASTPARGARSEVIACPGCDLRQRLPSTPPGARARCPRCGEVLASTPRDPFDRPLARLAAAEHRILLTRGRQLLMRQVVTHGCYVSSGSARDQIEELVRRLDLCAEIAPFTRCTVCNGWLLGAEAADVQSAVPPAVYHRHREYWRCGSCARLYWKGSHWVAMRRAIESICPSLSIQPPSRAAASNPGREICVSSRGIS